MRLAGNYGELRSNHFHAGLDIKSSKGIVGDSIFSVDSGFVSRIRITYSSYGKALYIDHPSGYTSVYAHLLNFSPTIEAYLHKVQKHLQSYSVDIYIDPDRLAITPGEFIGIMGSTGRSYGPHLHFEMRETESEIPVDPQRFGLNFEDTRKPVIEAIQIHALSRDLQDLNTFSLKNRSIKIPAWRVGISVKFYDQINRSSNRLGIRELQMYVDDSLYFKSTFDRISFDETRFINASIDYKTKSQKKQSFFRCFKLPGNHISIYDSLMTNGVFPIYGSKSRRIRIEASDYSGNKTTKEFDIRRDVSGEYSSSVMTSNQIQYNLPSSFTINNVSVVIPENALYQNTNISHNSMKPDEWHIGDRSIPLHRPMSFKIHNPIIDSDTSKWLLARFDGKKWVSHGGHMLDSIFYAHSKYFGKFRLQKDTIAPTITLLGNSINIKPGDQLKFSLKDNLPLAGNAKDMSYSCFINNEWVVGEYSSFRNTLLINIPEEIEKPIHVQIHATDDRGNVAKKLFKFN